MAEGGKRKQQKTLAQLSLLPAPLDPDAPAYVPLKKYQKESGKVTRYLGEALDCESQEAKAIYDSHVQGRSVSLDNTSPMNIGSLNEQSIKRTLIIITRCEGRQKT